MKDEALKLALETLEYAGPSWIDARQPAITAIKEALAQLAQQEPLECLDCGSHNVGIPASYDSLVDSVKTQPAAAQPAYRAVKTVHEGKPVFVAQRSWVGLTDGIMCDIAMERGLMDINWIDFARAIEAKLKEKNFD